MDIDFKFSNKERLLLLNMVNTETRKAQNDGKPTIIRLNHLYNLQHKLSQKNRQ